MVILGSGNLAWHLASRFASTGRYEIHVYNHRPSEQLYRFRSKLRCHIYDSFRSIKHDADVYLLCVSDAALAKVAAKVHAQKASALMLHTSGSMPLSVLGQRVHDTAVMYPLQSFTLGQHIHWKEVPLLLEASDAGALKKVKALASQLSPVQQLSNGQQRLRLHLAAVLVNNFPNALYAAAAALVGSREQFRLLQPLMQQTLSKLEQLSPLEAQTGPARRGDKVVQKKHLALLHGNKEVKKVYKQLTKLIVSQHKQEDA